MTTAFYPVGTWQQPEGVYETMYQQMSNPGGQVRSDYTTGYAGHQPEVRFMFGYSTPGPVLRATREPTIDKEWPMPDALERHTMRSTVRAEVASRVDKKHVLRPLSVPVEMSRTRHTSRAMDHRFPKATWSKHDPACPAAFEIRNPCSVNNPAPTLFRSSSSTAFDRLKLQGGSNAVAVDRDEPVSFPQGGTGYGMDARPWWPKESKPKDPVAAEDAHTAKWATSTSRAFHPLPYHRPLNLQ